MSHRHINRLTDGNWWHCNNRCWRLLGDDIVTNFPPNYFFEEVKDRIDIPSSDSNQFLWCNQKIFQSKDTISFHCLHCLVECVKCYRNCIMNVHRFTELRIWRVSQPHWLSMSGYEITFVQKQFQQTNFGLELYDFVLGLYVALVADNWWPCTNQTQ